MREIKFRAWDSDINKMEFWSMNDGDTGFWESAIFNNIYKVMQYTGLKDKNGVEIYEGDILRCENNFVWQVSYGDRGCFLAHDPKFLIEFCLLDDYDFEVIGNIYETYELLDAK